jgi:phosphate transport system ATP-binding protein
MKTDNTMLTNRTGSFDNCAVKLGMKGVGLYYGAFQALKDITLDIRSCAITAVIGPSGCGKSTLLRIFNRMNDLIPKVKVEGRVELDGLSIYDKNTDVASLRKRIGMVFQKPNPFPMTIFDNVSFGPRQHGAKTASLANIVEKSLRQAALWDEVKDKLKQSAMGLTPGQQQLMCIARALAVGPEVILMDEPCSALDPTATLMIEELMLGLVHEYTIIIVTHNMQQAARISDMAAFIMMDHDRAGVLAEYGPTVQLFTNPKDKRTEDYISGRFG